MDDPAKRAYNSYMTRIPVLPGVWWVEIPEADLRILCGTPMDVIKHLMNLELVARTEAGGAVFETGPNAILLSDIPVQAGRFWNLAEFPFLHMLYRQGMIIPGHPGNTGRKPVIIGMKPRCEAVLRYIYRGTYGLVSREEMAANGVPEADLDDLWNLKIKFAGGAIKAPDELVDLITVDKEEQNLPGGARIHRLGENLYRISYGDEQVEVNLNLPEGKDWVPSYSLPQKTIPDGRFTVTHIGEGNGWDPGRPCMGSMVSSGSRRYLIDAGPGTDYSLAALGLGLDDVDSLIFTHAHDDHFAGLTTFMESERKVTVYGTAPVIATVRHKAAALMEIAPETLDDMLDIRYLAEDDWNTIGEMEVRPTTSPHPLETTILFFRMKEGSEYRIYAHLADIISLSVLKKYMGYDGISRRFYDRVWKEYSRYADVKKIDAGRGLIHGTSEDFVDDTSARIILSHTEGGFGPGEEKYGIGVDFGDTDILIP